jgi:hypothetical protein
MRNLSDFKTTPSRVDLDCAFLGIPSALSNTRFPLPNWKNVYDSTLPVDLLMTRRVELS